MNNNLTLNQNKRIYYLDVLRCIACLAVILVHSSSDYVTADFSSFNHIVSAIFNTISHIGVPVFVMISGALMLDEDYKFTKDKLISHIKKMAIFFVFCSAFYDIFHNLLKPLIIGADVSITQLVTNFFRGAVHLWFVYMIVGLYLITPILRLWVKRENKKYVEYFIILALVFSFILTEICDICSDFNPYFKTLSIILDNLNLKYVGGYTAYFIIGWYINNFDIKNKKAIYILGSLSLLITIICIVLFVKNPDVTEKVLGYLTINNFLTSVMAFIFIKSKYSTVKPKENRAVKSVSKYSLGIYAIHPIIISVLSEVLLKLGINNAIINIPVIFFVSLATSYIATLILSKIPLLKKIV